jgi:hypothetical protein
MHPLPADIKLISESLESLIINGDNQTCVGTYMCPKLHTLKCSAWCTDAEAVAALESGTHAIDLQTVPEGARPQLIHLHGFAKNGPSLHHHLRRP